MSFTFPKINDSFRFEDLCRDILERKDGSAQKIGLNGQSQYGADIVSHLSHGEQYTQCKVRNKIANNKDRQKFWNEIITDYNACVGIYDDIYQFLVMTTVSRDSYFNVELSRFNKGITIRIEILFWEDICDLLETSQYRPVLEKYFSDVVNINPYGKIYGKRFDLSVGVDRIDTVLSLIFGYSPAVTVGIRTKYGDEEQILYRTDSYFVANVVDNWFRNIPEPGRCFISDFEGIHLFRMTQLDLAIFHKWLNEVVGVDPKAFIADEKHEYKFTVSREWYSKWLAERRTDGL